MPRDRFRRNAGPIACIIGAVLLGSGARAAVTQYADRTAFEAAAGAVQTQDFESFAPASVSFATQPFDFGDFSAFNGPEPGTGGALSTSSINGTTAMLCTTAVDGAELVFTFDRPVTAIGFDADNLADQRTNQVRFDNTAEDLLTINDSID